MFPSLDSDVAVVTVIRANWGAVVGGGGRWGTELCDRLLDPGAPNQGLSPAALTSVPPVASCVWPRFPGAGDRVRRLAWAPQSHREAGISLCHLVCPDVLPFSLPVYLHRARAAGHSCDSALTTQLNKALPTR